MTNSINPNVPIPKKQAYRQVLLWLCIGLLLCCRQIAQGPVKINVQCNTASSGAPFFPKNTFLSDITEVSRDFRFNYIYIDAIFLMIWIFLIIKAKKTTALKAGVCLGLFAYLIDSQLWWNLPMQGTPTGYVREYKIGDTYLPHPLGKYAWVKFSADFMMTISYALFAFTWMWLMYETWENQQWREMALFTLLWCTAWMLTPFLSQFIEWDNLPVHCVRHMGSQLNIQIITVGMGYILMLVCYATDIFARKDPKVILYVFVVGCVQAFMMEFPLFVFGIRPLKINLLIYEILILVNQGAPYLYIIRNLIGPCLLKIF